MFVWPDEVTFGAGENFKVFPEIEVWGISII